MSNISTFDRVKVETDEIEENGNILGAEIILANGDEIVALDCSEETSVYKNEYDSLKKGENITTCDLTGSYIVMLSDGNLKIIQAEELVNEDIAISTEASLLETSHSPNGLEVLQAHFPCLVDGCNKKFFSSSQLKIHQKKHSGVPSHECDLCKKKFSTGYALKAHKRMHTGEKPYICPEATCQKRFKTSGDLQKHIRTHTGERPFKCGLCPKAFTTSNIRKVHMRVHTGEKPYSCTHDGCEKRFSSATNFRNHLRTHTGEKPYVCSFQSCEKRFAEYSSLYKHYTVHSQKKRFECSLCDRHYRQLSTLNIHMNTIHKDKMNEVYKKSEHKLPITRNNPTLYKPKNSDALDDAKKGELFPSIAESHVVYPSASPTRNKDDTINSTIDFEPLKAITCGSEAILVLAVPSECDDSFAMGVEEKLQ